MAEKRLKLKTTEMGGKGGSIISLQHKSGLFYFITSFLIFSLSFQPVALASGRSNAGGGKIAKPDFGKVATNIGISVGTMIATSALSSAWEAAQPAATISNSANSGAVAVQGSTMAMPATMQGAAVTIKETSVPLFQQISVGAGNTFKTLGNFVTNTGGGNVKVAGEAVRPLAAMGNSLRDSFSFTSIANTAYLLKGLPTYAATYQVNRAVGMAGAYYGWKPSKTFIFSNVATGATAGFLEPELALGDSLPKNTAPSMLKGAFVGGFGKLASSAAIVAMAGKKIDQGKAPGAEAQIIGLVAGQAGTNLARAMVNPATYQVQVLQEVKPTGYSDVDVISKNGDLQINKSPSSLGEDKRIEKFLNPEKLQEREGLKEQLNGEIDNVIQEDFSVDYLWNRDKEMQKIVNYPKNLDKLNNLNKQYEAVNKGIQEELLASSVDHNPVAPNVYDFTLPIPAKSGTALYRIFLKAPIIDTFSRESWPGLAGTAVGILVSERVGTKSKWAPLYVSLGSAISQSVFSSIANLGGIGLDLYVGDKHDLTLARLQYIQEVKTTGLNYRMDQKLPDIDANADVILKNPETMKKIESLRGQLDKPLGEGGITSEQYEKEMKEIQKDLLPHSVNKDKPYLLATNLTKEEVGKIYTELGLPQSKNKLELEKELNALKNSTTDPYEFNLNFIRMQERMRVEDKMTFKVVDGERIDLSLKGSLKAVDSTRPKLILDNIVRGVLSNSFRTFIDSAVGIMLVKDGAAQNKPYLVALAGLVRGVAWDLSWRRTTKAWEWSPTDKKYTLWDYPEPEKYKGGSKPDEPNFDLMRYLEYKHDYKDNLDRWERTIAMDPTAITLDKHPERTKFILTPEGAKAEEDPRLVAHTVFYNDKKPSLRQHISASLRQAAMDYFTGTLSFGRPLVRLSVDDPHVGIEPRQVTSAMFMNYLDTLQNLSQMSFADATDYTARQATINSVSKSIASSLAQIPLPGKNISSVGELFSLQPERLVLKGKYIRGQAIPVFRRTGKFESINYMITPQGAQDYPFKDTIESTVYETEKPKIPQVPEGISDDAIGFADKWTPAKESSLTDKKAFWRKSVGGISWGEVMGQQDYSIKSGDETFDYPPRQYGGPFGELPGPQPQEVPPGAPQVLPISTAAQEELDNWSLEYGVRTVQINTQAGERTYFYVTNPVSYTIEHLGYGGGGLPHAATGFWTPFPNPSYNLVPQTGPTHYLKRDIKAAADMAVLPPATAPGGSQPASPNLYEGWAKPILNNLDNNLLNTNKKDGNRPF